MYICIYVFTFPQGWGELRSSTVSTYISSDVILYGRFLTYSTLFTSGGSLTFALALFIAILDVWVK